MGRIPGNHIARLVQTDPVMVANNGRAFAFACPVAAGCVTTSRRKVPVRIRSGQDVMFVGLRTPPVDLIAVLIKASLEADVDAVAVQVINVFRNHNARGIVPRTRADPIPGADAIGHFGAAAAAIDDHAGAEVSGPCFGGSGCRGQRCAMRIRAFEAAIIRTIATAYAGDEERHFIGVAIGKCGDGACAKRK